MPLPRTSPRLMRALAVTSVVANLGLVVTGGAVRLTGSGLGCPTWPRCTDESFVTTPENGIHGYVEFGNRVLTGVLGAVALATLVAAWRVLPRRGDLRALASALLLGIPAQAVIGGITVRTHLNPWVVMLHFLCSMALVAAATVLVRRAGAPPGPHRLAVPASVHRLGLGVAATGAAVIYLGTVVTGSGPHAGDRAARRTGLDPQLVSQLHADGVLLLIGLTVGLVVLARAVGAPAAVRRGAGALLAVELAQGAVGYLQYFTGLPVALVNLHMLGAGLLVVTGTLALLAMWRPAAASGATADLHAGHPPPRARTGAQAG